ncbi:hypothetical protein R3P38DRAFT_3194708 [Favolaschia claudopus]|uniref:Uncharacterized protein n=1 Tax=Favolaschia claudopus TaxID=2862362 RepID=A0AAW0BE22_9AGAR
MPVPDLCPKKSRPSVDHHLLFTTQPPLRTPILGFASANTGIGLKFAITPILPRALFLWRCSYGYYTVVEHRRFLQWTGKMMMRLVFRTPTPTSSKSDLGEKTMYSLDGAQFGTSTLLMFGIKLNRPLDGREHIKSRAASAARTQNTQCILSRHPASGRLSFVTRDPVRVLPCADYDLPSFLPSSPAFEPPDKINKPVARCIPPLLPSFHSTPRPHFLVSYRPPSHLSASYWPFSLQ